MDILRAGFLLLMERFRHGLTRQIPIDQIPNRFGWAKVEIGVTRAHDIGVLLRPFGLTSEPDYYVRTVVDNLRKNKVIVKYPGLHLAVLPGR